MVRRLHGLSNLRWDNDRLDGKAGIEGIVRYDHQGGGQDNAGEIIVPFYNTTMKKASLLGNISQKHNKLL